MAQKQKYYVVWEGVEPGIYSSWSDCQEQIKGYPGAKYRAYSSEQEARAAFHSGWESPKAEAIKKVSRDALPPEVITDSLAVDGACSGNPGATEYRGVHVGSGQLIFHQGPFAGGSNNRRISGPRPCIGLSAKARKTEYGHLYRLHYRNCLGSQPGHQINHQQNR